MSSHKNLLTAFVLIALLALTQTALSQPYATGCLREETLPSWVQPSPPIDLAGQYEEYCDLSPNFPPIGSQGGQGSCTCWATGYYYKSYQEWEEHGWDLTDLDHRFSPAFIYNQINGGGDNGSYVSDAFKLLCDLGCASWSLMPYTDQNCTTQPDEEDYYFALPYRSQTVYTINLSSSLTDIKNHLLNGHAAVFAISVYENFNNIGNYNNTYCLSEIYGSNPGGHAVTFCGFDDNRVTSDGIGAFKVANSWGTGWGSSGYFWMSYQAVQSPILCWGTAFYCTDRIDYQPTVIARFQVEHDDRYAVTYNFGIGNIGNPLWSQNFFNWYMSPHTAWPYPPSDIVVDLSDGAGFLNPGSQNAIYMSCSDRRAWNGLDGEVLDFAAMELTWPGSAESPDPPVAIPDNGGSAYADLEISQTSGTQIGGEVSGTWSTASSPFFVTDDLSVPSGQTLTIQPGVDVQFMNHYKLIVFENASLQAIGTNLDSIRFSAFIPAVGWGGVRFEGASNDSRLDYCYLEHGKANGEGNDALGGGIFCLSSDPTLSNCRIENCTATRGGAIYCQDSNPTLTGSELIENSASDAGGGIYCQGSNPSITDNTISGNSANNGSGIYLLESGPTISDNTLEGNSASDCGGGIGCSASNFDIIDNTINDNTAAHGGGIGCRSSNVTIEGNSFEGNYGSQGGGVFVDSGEVSINSNTFSGNSAARGGAVHGSQAILTINANTITGNSSGNGGGIACLFCEVTVADNVITDNLGNGYGGGIYCLDCDVELTNNLVGANVGNFGGGICLTDAEAVVINNTISRNEAWAQGGGLYGVYGAQPVLMNCIVYYNSPQQIYLDNASDCPAAYCDVQGGWEGVGNINENPWFVSPSDYHLNPWSPCIGAGIASVEIGGVMYQAPTTDLDGNPRPDPVGSNPDLGAYEHTLATPTAVQQEYSPDIPRTFALYPNHPNPFNPATTIRFDLPRASHVRLCVYDVSGRLVSTLVDGYRDAGVHQVTFDASQLASGVYVYRITAGDFTASGKMVLMK